MTTPPRRPAPRLWRSRRLWALVAVAVALAVFGGWWLFRDAGADDRSRIASELTDAGRAYLEARNQVRTIRGGSGIAPAVLMTTGFEAGLRDQIDLLRARPATQYERALTTLSLVSHDVEDERAAIVVVEHTRLPIGDHPEGIVSEYTLEHRLRFVRRGEDWLLASDEVLGCGAMPETFPGPPHVDCDAAPR